MFYQKVLLLLVSFIFVSMAYAQENASVADEAQTQADKIADVAAELQRLSAEAESSGDSKLKDCIDGNLGSVKGLAASASGMVSRIASLAEAGKADEAASQLEALNGMAESADQLLAKAQSCEGGDPNKAQTKKESDSKNKKPATGNNTNTPDTANVNANANVNVNTADVAAESDSKAESDTNAEAATEESTVDDNTSVSDAMSLDMGSDMVTETERSVEGSDSADAAGADASDIQQSGNETTADDFTTAQTPTDTTSEPLPEHEPEEIEQSPTR